MSYKFQAPLPALQTTTLLPNPEFGDSENLAGTVEIKRSMNGEIYSYVKSRDGRQKFIWEFRLTRHKALELREFFNAYHSSDIRITTTDGSILTGKFTSNPFEFETVNRSLFSPGREMVRLQIEFEGIQDG